MEDLHVECSQHSSVMRCIATLVLPALLTLLNGCAGYRLGAQTMYPSHVRTVHVPIFESDSLRPELGQWLTEAVVKQIERNTDYKVVGRDHADTVLEGVLIRDTKGVGVTTVNDDPRGIEVGLYVQVRWTDNQGRLVHPEATVPLPVALSDIQEVVNQVPEVGHSTVSSQQAAIERLAEQIVAMMETPW